MTEACSVVDWSISNGTDSEVASRRVLERVKYEQYISFKGIVGYFGARLLVFVAIRIWTLREYITWDVPFALLRIVGGKALLEGEQRIIVSLLCSEEG